MKAGKIAERGDGMSRLLVVEDDPDITTALRLLFGSAGYEVVHAGDGRAGLREAYAAHPDLVVLDVGLPEMDGWAVLERLRDISDEDWRFLIRVNLETTFQVARACARCFERAGGGALIVASSPAALLGEAGTAAYAAAKAGTLRLVESLAREIGPRGGRANAVLPGTMDTPANRREMPDADRSQWVTTDAVAEVIYYLATPAAAAINGAAIRVPGPAL